MSEKRKQDSLLKYYTPAALGLTTLQSLMKIPSGTAAEATRRSLLRRLAAKGNEFAREELKPLKKGTYWRGVSKGLAHLPVALATTPIFLSGMADLSSSDPERRRRGRLKILASTAAYGFGTGALTTAILKRTGGETAPVLRSALGHTVESVLKGLPVATAIAAVGTALQRKKQQEEQAGTLTPGKRVAYAIGGPLASGAVSAGLTTALMIPETLISMPKGYKSWEAFKGITGPRLAGAAVAGFLGGAILDKITDLYKRRYEKMEKHSQVETEQKTIPGLKVSLYPYQERALEKFIQNRGVILLGHPTGTGKTTTSLAAQQLLRLSGHSKTALVVVPAGLKNNYAENIEKVYAEKPNVVIVGSKKGQIKPEQLAHLPEKPDFVIVSYETLNQHPEIVDIVQPDTLIADEVHRVRNEGSLYKTLMYARQRSKFFIGMTASVVNNSPAEVAPLLSLVVGQPVLSQRTFKSRFLQSVGATQGFFGGRKVIYATPPTETLQQLGRFIDYIPPEESLKGRAPDKDVEFVKVPMSSEQETYYKYVLKQLNPITAWKIRHNVPLNDKELTSALAILTKAREVSNSVGAVNPNLPPEQIVEQSPKLKRVVMDAVQHLKENPRGQIIIYSNFVNNGIKPIAAALNKLNIPFGVFIGRGKSVEGISSSEAERQKAVEDFRAGKTRVLLISGAGAEGLNLPDTTLIQIVDGHFNPERILQAEARGVRIGGLSYLPPEQRKVKIKRYIAAAEEGALAKIFGETGIKSVDEYVYRIAALKYRANQAFLNTINKASPPPPDTLERTLQFIKQHAPVSQEVQAPKAEVPKGIPLTKDPKAKYIQRWRTPEGKIIYEYKHEKPGNRIGS